MNMYISILIQLHEYCMNLTKLSINKYAIYTILSHYNIKIYTLNYEIILLNHELFHTKL